MRHLGVPYANFVTGSGDGLDVELIKLFAAHLGVKYQYVKTSWKDVIGDLTGEKVIPKGDAELTLLGVPDALIALEKWPGKIKIIGPLSAMQDMACAFAKTSPQLRDAFNRFLEKCQTDGTYLRLVKKYYPAVFDFYPQFFADKK